MIEKKTFLVGFIRVERVWVMNLWKKRPMWYYETDNKALNYENGK